MGLFSRRLSDSQKKEALALVDHLQTMLAYQQLTMEIYNDAIAGDTGEIPHGAELTHRFGVVFSDPTLVAKYVLPAMEKKIEIFQLMETKHRNASFLAPGSFQQPYHDMTLAISALLERAHYMYQGFRKWVNNEVRNANVTGLEEKERMAIDRAIKSLNELIFQKIGLTTDEWLVINQKAFNTVRTSLQLPPLDIRDFISRYTRGVNGEHVRMYTD